MKKCIVLFTILIVVLIIAVLTDKTNHTILKVGNQMTLDSDQGSDFLANETVFETIYSE
ncbi:MAG: hypothetical protein AAFO99_11415 [Bacteroidota bacterium]